VVAATALGGGARRGARDAQAPLRRPPAPTGGGPASGCEAINAWLWSLLDPPEEPRVLDVGSGFGATLFDWARRCGGGSFVGLSLSPFQVRMAGREAERLGVNTRCSFRRQSYDDPIDGRYDVVVSLESLFHAPDLAVTLRGLSGVLAPGGVLVLVEDMALRDDAADDPDGRALLERWTTERLHTVDDYRRALAEAGLTLETDIDLSAQVDASSPEDLRARERRILALRRVAPLPSVRRVLDAFLGGFALERLYGRGRMAYRAMLATRAEETA